MSKKLVPLFVLCVLLAGCGTAQPTPLATGTAELQATPAGDLPALPEATSAPAPAAAGLKLTGKVGQEMAWTEDEVRAMPTVQAQATNKQGETQTYTGVPIKNLLALAAPAAGATMLVMVGDDGYVAEVPLADVLACDTCIVSFRSQGGLSTVMPGMPGEASVKGVIELQVK